MPESTKLTYQTAQREYARVKTQKTIAQKEVSPNLQVDREQRRKLRQLNKLLKDQKSPQVRIPLHSDDEGYEKRGEKGKEEEEKKLGVKKRENAGALWYDTEPADNVPHESKPVGEEDVQLMAKKPDTKTPTPSESQQPHVHGTMCKLLSWVGMGDYTTEDKAPQSGHPEKAGEAEPKPLPSGLGTSSEEVTQASESAMIEGLQKKIRSLLEKKHDKALERSLKDLDNIPSRKRLEFLQKALNRLESHEGGEDYSSSENDEETQRVSKELLDKARKNGSTICDHSSGDNSLESDIESIFEREEDESHSDKFPRSRSESSSSSDSETAHPRKRVPTTDPCTPPQKTALRRRRQISSDKNDHQNSSQAVVCSYGDCPCGCCSTCSGNDCSRSRERSDHNCARNRRDGIRSNTSSPSSPSRSACCKNMQSNLNYELKNIFCRGCKREKEEKASAKVRRQKNLTWREKSCPDLSYEHTCGARGDLEAGKLDRNGKLIRGCQGLQEDRRVLLVSPWALDVVLPGTDKSQRCRCPERCYHVCTCHTKYAGTQHSRRDRSREHGSHQEGQKNDDGRTSKPCRHEASKHPKSKKRARTTGLDETALKRLKDLLHEYTYRDKNVGASSSAGDDSDSEEEKSRRKRTVEENSHGTDAPAFSSSAVDKRLSAIQNLYQEKTPLVFDETYMQVEHTHDSSDEDEKKQRRKKRHTEDEAVQCSARSSRRNSSSLDEDTLKKMRDILRETSQFYHDESSRSNSNSSSCSSSGSSCSRCRRHTCSRERKTRLKNKKVGEDKRPPKKEVKQKEHREGDGDDDSSSSASEACRIGAFWRKRFRRCRTPKCPPCPSSRQRSKEAPCKQCGKTQRSFEGSSPSACRGRHRFRRSELHELAQFMKDHGVTGPPSRSVEFRGHEYDRLLWKGPLHGGTQQLALCQYCQSQSSLNRIPAQWQLHDRELAHSRSLASLPTNAYVKVELGPIRGPEAASTSTLQLPVLSVEAPRQKQVTGEESQRTKEEKVVVKVEEDVVKSEAKAGEVIDCQDCSRGYRHVCNGSSSPFPPSRRRAALSGAGGPFLAGDWLKTAPGEREDEKGWVGEGYNRPKQQEGLDYHHVHRNHHHHHHHKQKQKRTNQERRQQQQQQHQQQIKLLSEQVDKLFKRPERKEDKAVK
ncbi:hypothetical protein SprV_0702287800 [Sparganum proliferum]